MIKIINFISGGYEKRNFLLETSSLVLIGG